MDDRALLPVDGAVAHDTRSGREAAVKNVGADSVVTFVPHLASRRPVADMLLVFALVEGVDEDCGRKEDRGVVGAELLSAEGWVESGCRKGECLALLGLATFNNLHVICKLAVF